MIAWPKRAMGCLPGTHQTRTGVLPTITGSVASSSPTTTATRYVDITMVSANRIVFFPGAGPGRVLTTRVFDTAASFSSTTRLTAKTALNAGSSQHGKARRASVASSWVAASTCSTPLASTYRLR